MFSAHAQLLASHVQMKKNGRRLRESLGAFTYCKKLSLEVLWFRSRYKPEDYHQEVRLL